jgi:cysteine-rich repeat protein
MVEEGYQCNLGFPNLCSEICGDGTTVGGEECDDSNDLGGDGCSASCTVEMGYTCTPAPSLCTTTCGDGVQVVGVEGCDDGNIADGDGCGSACQPELGWDCTGLLPTTCTPVCGDSIKLLVEECDDGNTTGGDGCDAICEIESGWVCTGSPSTCSALCGDGVLSVPDGEQCDDGNNFNGDGCDAFCQQEPGWTCDQSGCVSICGDGLTVGAEECDDGNASDNDNCLSTCLNALCGDGIVWDQGSGTEQCDEGAGNSDLPDATCRTNCRPQRCGDSIVDTLAGEACDDGNIVPGDGCGQTCVVEACGNAILDPGEVCDDGNNDNCDGCRGNCSAVETGCGDTFLCGSEVCDDGNNANCDGCRGDCSAWEKGWGDGFLCGSEVCDDGNNVNCDGCRGDCSNTEFGCGDGYLCGSEVCDDGNQVDCDGCRGNCSAPETGCGDGFVCGSEACDDGNNLNCDGCRADCLAVETGCGDGFHCPGELCDDGNNDDCDGCRGDCSDTELGCGDGYICNTEVCDDGNTTAGDGCDASCAEEPGWTCASEPSVCEAVGEVCSNALVITDSTSLSADTSFLLDDYSGTGCGDLSGGDTRGPDQVWAIDLAAGEGVTVWITPSGWDALLYLSTDCSGPGIEISCVEGWDRAFEAGAMERLDYVDGGAGGLVYLVVDGVGVGDGGAYDLDILIHPAVATAAASELVFSELMANPDGQHFKCQWFEVYNDAAATVDLDTLVFKGGASQFTVNRTLLLEPGGFLVLGTYAEPSRNCGLNGVSWLYTGVDLPAAPSSPYTLRVELPDTTLIDEVTYESGWISATAGQSTYLCTSHYDAAENDDATNWAINSADSYGGGTNYGTPGGDNLYDCN